MHTHIFNKRVRMLCRRSRSLSLREYFVDQMVVVGRRPPRSLLFSLFLSSSFFSDKFRVFKSQALSRHVFPPLLVSRGDRFYSTFHAQHARTQHKTHTQKMQSMIAQRASAFARAPRMTRQVRKKRDSNLFLVC